MSGREAWAPMTQPDSEDITSTKARVIIAIKVTRNSAITCNSAIQQIYKSTVYMMSSWPDSSKAFASSASDAASSASNDMA